MTNNELPFENLNWRLVAEQGEQTDTVPHIQVFTADIMGKQLTKVVKK